MRTYITTIIHNRYRGFISFILAISCALFLYQSIMVGPAYIVQSPWLDIGLELALISLIGFSLLALSLNSAWRPGIILSLLSLFLLAIMTLVLKETPYPFGGLGGDQRFYAAYVTKLAAYSGYIDVMYRDLPTFYPPLYYYLLGRGAALMSIEPYQMLKIGLLITAFGLPFLMAGLWRTLLNYKAAVLLTFALIIAPQWFKPAEWISEVLFIPWWLYWVENLQQRQPESRWQRLGWYGIGGLIGGLLFQNYYYWFFIGGISLLVNWIHSWRSPSEKLSFFLKTRFLNTNNSRLRLFNNSASKKLSFQKKPQFPDTGKTTYPPSLNFSNAILMLGSAALFSANYWLPYLYSMYVTGGWTPLQTRWLTSGKIELPLPFLELSISGAVAMMGLITLWVGAYSSSLCQRLRNLFIAAYLWLALGYVAILLDQPLLSFRAYPLMEHLLILGALLGLAGLWFPEINIWPRSLSPQIKIIGQRIAPVLGIALLCFFAADSARDLKDNKYIVRAIEEMPPQLLLQEFDTLTNGISRDKSLWADASYIDLFAYRPLYTFLPWSAHFSHPAGLFHQRVDLLEKLATTHSPKLFAAALMNNRYDPVDYIMLKQANGQRLFSYSEDNFPDRTRLRTFAYPTTLFSEAYFEIRQSDGYSLLLPRADQNPLLTVDQDTISVETWAQWYALRATFGEHVEIPAAIPDLSQIEQRLIQANLSQLPQHSLLDLDQSATGEFAEQVRAALIQKWQSNSTLYQVSDLNLMDQVGGHKLKILAYEVGESDLDSFNLTIYFEVLSPLDHDYMIWLHAFQDGNKSILDHLPIVPTTTWRNGKIYRDIYTIPFQSSNSNIEFGFWNQEKDVRLVQTSWEMGVRLELTNHIQP